MKEIRWELILMPLVSIVLGIMPFLHSSAPSIVSGLR